MIVPPPPEGYDTRSQHRAGRPSSSASSSGRSTSPHSSRWSGSTGGNTGRESVNSKRSRGREVYRQRLQAHFSGANAQQQQQRVSPEPLSLPAPQYPAQPQPQVQLQPRQEVSLPLPGPTTVSHRAGQITAIVFTEAGRLRGVAMLWNLLRRFHSRVMMSVPVVWQLVSCQSCYPRGVVLVPGARLGCGFGPCSRMYRTPGLMA